MPRTRLIFALGLLAAAFSGAGEATHPHLDPSLVPGGCRACHEGHGASGSPMLIAPQMETCLRCHESRARADEQVRRGILAAGAEPPLLGAVLSLPSTHPLSESAFSRFEAGAVTCSSCHSIHRRSTALPGTDREGIRKISPRSPLRFEFELCESCHGAQGPRTRSLLDASRSFDPGNRSFHPVHAPAAERSPSIRSGLEAAEINCTDCHNSREPGGARGPHGSLDPPLLASGYRLTDGAGESSETYALCYSCHARERVLDGSPFELHRLHVVDENAACATCHSAHGSLENRSLIRFGEETTIAGVQPSLSTGRIEFVSAAPGSGLCFLTCHGVDHAPRGYGAEGAISDALRRLGGSGFESPLEPPRPGGASIPPPPRPPLPPRRPKIPPPS